MSLLPSVYILNHSQNLLITNVSYEYQLFIVGIWNKVGYWCGKHVPYRREKEHNTNNIFFIIHGTP